LPRVFAFAAARMKFDELYASTFGKLNSGFSFLAAWLDRRVWGAVIDSLARLGETAGRFNRETDDDGLNAGFNAASEELRTVGKRYSRAQTGEAHGYLRIMAIGFVVLAILAIIGGRR